LEHDWLGHWGMADERGVLVCGFVARRSQPPAGMLPPRASPQTKFGATNVPVFKNQATKPDISHFLLRLSLTPGLQPGEKRRG
jgi:hypothetical protein